MRMRRGCLAHPTARFQRSARVENNQRRRSAIVIGAHSVVAGELLVFRDGGRLEIGEYSFVGEGSRIWSSVDVTIGNRVLISHNVNIHDSISHSLSAAERHEHFKGIFVNRNLSLKDIPKSPIAIEDDVWIGYSASIMHGVRIGRGAIVAAGAFVNRDVAPFTIVSGAAAIAIGPSLP